MPTLRWEALMRRGGNPKVAAVPHPSGDEEDEGGAYHEEDYADDEEEEVEFEG
jgi:hypothetical protein